MKIPPSLISREARKLDTLPAALCILGAVYFIFRI